MVGVDKDRRGGTVAANHFHDPAVRQLRKAAPAIRDRYGHAQDAQLSQARDDVGRNLGVPVDGGGVDFLVGKTAHLLDGLGHRLAFFGLEFGIGINLVRVELPEEQAVGKSQPLGPGEKDFFGLFDLLLAFLCRHRHG